MQLKMLVKKLFAPKKDEQTQRVAACVFKQVLQNKNLFSEENIVTDKIILDRPITVSLTTYSSRIHDVFLAIESLGYQSIKANNIVLWLDEEEVTKKDLPTSLSRLQKRGLQIKFCPNFKSYKKLIPSLTLFPTHHIITTDDDIMYPTDFVERFISAASKEANVVLCNHAHEIAIKRNCILPYRSWIHGTNNLSAQENILPVGVGGVFYPFDTFKNQSMDFSLIKKVAPTTDDLWFKCMAHRNGFYARKIRTNLDFESNFLQIPGSQAISLFEENLGNNLNDTQLQNIVSEFNIKFRNSTDKSN